MKYKDIKTPEELYSYMKENIKYGFVSNLDNEAYTRKDLGYNYEKLLFETYYLQTPEELLKSKCGICFDQVAFAKTWLTEHNYPVKTYFSLYHNHSFLIYKDKATYNLFETTNIEHSGIFRLNSLEHALLFYKSMQVASSKKKIWLTDIDIKEYEDIPYGTGLYEYIDFAKQGPEKNKQLQKKIARD